MEFPNLGIKCSWSLCKTLDFLPLKCIYCNQAFCKNHFNKDSHECQSKNQITKTFVTKTFVCTTEECNTISPVEMLCQKCQKHFCLVHRYHDCFDSAYNIEQNKYLQKEQKEQFAESLRYVHNTINENIKKAVQDPKKQALASKIQLMRIKGKAEGISTIPIMERIYFLILLPKDSKKISKAIFVSKEWSVGKIIDEVSKICNITNKNNDMYSSKLRLFKATDGTQISIDTSVKIINLINSKKIENGESLIIEYVHSNEDIDNFVLRDFSEYNNSL